MPYFACASCQSDVYTAVSYLHAMDCPVCGAAIAAAKDPRPSGFAPVRGNVVARAEATEPLEWT